MPPESKRCLKIKPPKKATVAGFNASATAAPGDWFDVDEFERLDKFFNLLVHQKGPHAGKPFALLPWQLDLIGTLLCWKRADGLRRFRQALIEVPRKNGKSTMLAGILLYLLLVEDEPGAEIYCAASSRDQAAVVGDCCRQMIQANQVLARATTVQRNVITFGTSKLEILSADAGTKHGRNASALCVDELHTFDEHGRELFNTMASSQGSRLQPLNISITTAGHNRNSLAYELHGYAEKVRDGIISDHKFLPALYGADIEDDWTSPKVWRKANPSLGITVSEEFLRSECEKAKELPAYSTTFRTLYLNQWVESRRTWIGNDAWKACTVDGLSVEALAGREAWLGLDLSSNVDLTSLACIVPGDNGELAVISYTWCPEDGIRRRSRADRAPYDVWAEQGWLKPTPGQVINYKFVEERIRELCRTFRVRQIGYDPWSATQLATNLYNAERLPMLEVRQGFRTLSEPSKKLEALVMSRKLQHGGNPLLTWAVSNACIDMDPAANIKVSKKTSVERIDPLAAIITAMAAWMNEGNATSGPSVYEDQGKAIEWV